MSNKGPERLKRGVWTDDEDDLLRTLISERGPQNWSHIAENIKGRSGKSCRLRWCNQLDPSLNKHAFSPWEDALIIRMQEDIGNKWASISSHLSGRTDNAVKNHWNSTLKRKWASGHLDNEFIALHVTELKNMKPVDPDMMEDDEDEDNSDATYLEEKAQGFLPEELGYSHMTRGTASNNQAYPIEGFAPPPRRARSSTIRLNVLRNWPEITQTRLRGAARLAHFCSQEPAETTFGGSGSETPLDDDTVVSQSVSQSDVDLLAEFFDTEADPMAQDDPLYHQLPNHNGGRSGYNQAPLLPLFETSHSAPMPQTRTLAVLQAAREPFEEALVTARFGDDHSSGSPLPYMDNEGLFGDDPQCGGLSSPVWDMGFHNGSSDDHDLHAAREPFEEALVTARFGDNDSSGSPLPYMDNEGLFGDDPQCGGLSSPVWDMGL